jgi:hypothetical protein
MPSRPRIATPSSKQRWKRRGARGRLLPLLACLLLSSVTHAQTDAVKRENAQALYKDGNDARDAGDMMTAAAKYKNAYALVQTPIIGDALGKAQIAIGQLIEGRQTLIGVGSIPIKPNESARTASARAEASTLAGQTEARIPTVTIKLVVPTGATPPSVTIDGVPVPDVALNAPWKLNPGQHTAVATLSETKTQSVFNLDEAEARDVPLDYPAPSPQPGAGAPGNIAPGVEGGAVEPTVGTALHTPSRDTSRAAPSPAPAYVALGVGGAGVVVTAIFGALALKDRAALDGLCTTGKSDCPTSAQSDITGLHTSSIASDVGLGVAVAGAGVGTALLLFRRGASSSPPSDRTANRPRDVHVEPWVGSRELGITGSF